MVISKDGGFALTNVAWLFLLSLAALGGEAPPSALPDQPDPGREESPAARGLPSSARIEGTVNADSVNTRLAPDLQAHVIGQLSTGAEVRVRASHGDWYEIDYPALFGPWVSAKYVRVEGEVGDATAEAPLKGTAGADRLRIRSRPSLRGRILDEAARDEELRVVGVSGAWVKIAPPEELRVFIYARYVDVPPGAEIPSAPATPELALMMSTHHEPGQGTPAAPGLPGELRARLDEARRLAASGRLDRAAELIEKVLTDPVSPNRGAEIRSALDELVSSLPAGARAELLALIRRRCLSRLENMDSAYSRKIERARKDLPKVAFTAVGVLRAPPEGGGLYRLMQDEIVLYELRPVGVELGPHAGKRIGVVGEVLPGRGRGRPPVIEVRFAQVIEK